MSDPSPIGDVKALICADLERQQRGRRRHFLPALAIAVMSIVTMLTVMGIRPDLIEQPFSMLAPYLLLWATCLIALPAIGVGIWFPPKWARVILVVMAVALTIVTSLGLSTPTESFSFSVDHCSLFVVMYGAMLVGLGVISGAFEQRRGSAAIYWIAGGVSLTALQTLTTQCPVSGVSHIATNHLGGAGLLLAMAAAVGYWAHRRREEPESGSAA
jgi:hypothetical protein